MQETLTLEEAMDEVWKQLGASQEQSTQVQILTRELLEHDPEKINQILTLIQTQKQLVRNALHICLAVQKAAVEKANTSENK